MPEKAQCGSPLPAHSLESIFDNGFPDAPAWRAVCECGWEAWDQPSEISARSHHCTHVENVEEAAVVPEIPPDEPREGTRIVFIDSDQPTDQLAENESLEIAASGWIHVRAFEKSDFGQGKRVRSYSPHVVASVLYA